MASTPRMRAVTTIFALCGIIAAQEPGSTAEVHPSLVTSKCTTSGGCVTQNTSVVMDWTHRWIHTADGVSCVTSSGSADPSLCPDEATCAANCVVDGVDYASQGVSTSGNTLTMSQYVQSDGTTTDVSPRIYLLSPDGENYEMLQLLGQELTVTVDLSSLPCGENGALYLSEMDVTGGRNADNTGGAAYGSGYCDAQCPVQTWRNGTLNTSGATYCCNEMDVLEANSVAGAFTTHPCASETACDPIGCSYNPYAQGYTNYYGPGLTVDTSKPFTMVTQFLTSDGTKSGTLTSVVRKYIQDGKIVASAMSGGDNVTEPWCEAHNSNEKTYGGLETMGEALGRGMVLIFSIWNDHSGYMNWLDSGSAGPCSSTAGDPDSIKANYPTTHVVFSDLRWGDIGSTFDA